MLDVHSPNPSSARGKRSVGMNGTSLNHWIRQSLESPQMRVRSRLRGNDLHVLLENQSCPETATVMSRLMSTLTANVLAALLLPETAPVYRVVVYGRQLQHPTPEWTELFYLNPTDHRVQSSPALLEPDDRSLVSGVASSTAHEGNIDARLGGTPLDRARQGQPEAIAHYLSDAFSNLGISVRAKLQSHNAAASAQLTSSFTQATSDAHSTPSDAPSSLKRLCISCESAFSPDHLLLAEPIAQHLRALELKGFQDAIVFGQVTGEAKPDWMLRVDLTPPDDMLKEWARWGDVQAVTRLLNRTLQSQQIQISALLKDATLHLTCRSTYAATPDKLTTIAAVVPFLEALSPQGIRAATIYGFAQRDTSAPLFSTVTTPAPVWVHWLDLPTDRRLQSTLALAQQGHLDAITFLLTRLLNPNLDRKLATGGIRVQVRQRADLLHIMNEAPICPLQSQIGPAIARFVKPLQISALTGVRIYGRRSGQKQPLWSYGVDFAPRDRLVPEATPEFAVSDAYVGDLLSPPGALVLRTEFPPDRAPSFLSHLFESAMQRMQRSLIWSQLFIPSDSAALPSSTADPLSKLLKASPQQSKTVALVWGTVGLLCVVQADWILNQLLQPPSLPAITIQPASPSAASPVAVSSGKARPKQQWAEPQLPNLSLKKSKAGDKTAFNASGFTQPGTETTSASSAENDLTSEISTSDATVPLTPVSLPVSPLRSKVGSVTRDAKTYPTFNSRQLDEKLALYQSYLVEHGSPDILIIGSSRALRGVDPIALQKALASQGYTGATIFNFGVNGATAQVVDIILTQLLPQDKLPKLILWADGARAFNSGRVDITYNGILASEGYKVLATGRSPFPGSTVAQIPAKKPEPDQHAAVTEDPPTLMSAYQSVNQALNQRLGSISATYSQRDHLKALLRDGLANTMSKGVAVLAWAGAVPQWSPLHDLAPNSFSETTSPAASAANTSTAVLAEGQNMIDIDGFLPLSNRFNPATYYQKYARVNGDYDSDYDSFGLEGKQTQALINLVQFSQTHQIPLVFVNLPLTSDYLDPTRKGYEEDFQQHMLRLSTPLGFIYRDLSQAFIKQPDYFSDPSHLNRYGAYEVSRRLAIDVMIPWHTAQK